MRRIGAVGAGAVLPMFTAAFAIPFCINALEGDGGPATLASLLVVAAVTQFAVSRWLFLVRRIVTPLRNYAQSMQHQQFQDTDITTVRVGQPGT